MSGSNQNHADHVLALESFHVHYGSICALRNVSHRFICGTAVALVGGNGAGKSTLMKGIVGLVPASAGEVVWCGEPITKSTHEIAFLPQRADINWEFPMTVRGLVEMGRYPLLGAWRPYTPADDAAVDRALATMQITDLAKRQVGALSGGQQQRVLIARALAQEAHVLLLDEPFAGLDQPAQDLLARLLKELAASGCLIIASHHDLKTLGDIFDEVVLLNGALIAAGTSDEVMTEANLTQAFGNKAES
jgi:ABC-type Mn2+/Zn2+ transport system ATPase subunit